MCGTPRVICSRHPFCVMVAVNSDFGFSYSVLMPLVYAVDVLA